MSVPMFDAQSVESLLDYPGCIAAMRAAMTALSSDDRPQPLRQIMHVGPDRMFGLMPGALPSPHNFGAKLVSVFPEAARPGRSRHQGVVVSFSPRDGAVECVVDAEAVTSIRTACATAAATDALARPDAQTLVIFGGGAQAETHIRAISLVRDLKTVLLWGRDPKRASARAAELSQKLGLSVSTETDAAAAAGRADILCTVSSSKTPIVLGRWLRPGVHVNLVGSSHLGPVEVDSDLVVAGRYIADYRPSVLAQAAELAVARDAGLIGDDHVVGEIGQVFAGTLAGRQGQDQVTIYKSLGHVVQDLAAAAYVLERSRGTGSTAPH